MTVIWSLSDPDERAVYSDWLEALRAHMMEGSG